jgi:leucyl-tRNA synthetase
MRAASVVYCADTAHLFTVFAAPPEKDLEWSDQAVEDSYRFLSRLLRFIHQNRQYWSTSSANGDDSQVSPELRDLRRAIHRTIKKVSDDIDGRFHFNTAIAAIMELFNALSAAAQVKSESSAARQVVKEGTEAIIVLLAPFVPHVASELWEELSHGHLDQAPWPSYSEAALAEEELLIVVQVNGKVRGKITVPADVTQEYIETNALADPKVLVFLDGKNVRRVVYVPRRLVNIVVEG